MVVEALVVAAMFSAIIESGLVPKFHFTLVNVISIIGLVFLIDKSRYWSFGYLAGWILGLFFSLGTLIQTEFLGVFDLLVYGATAFGAVYLRAKIHM
ncbi:hypothetical protein ACH9L7_19810 (plasmid) [Haloferax sp. S1W]|uniref:hypothetical protein n=1 Tax=Haloferax sp. S1W TaxID=3377110 RepID=UPI0037CC1590